MEWVRGDVEARSSRIAGGGTSWPQHLPLAELAQSHRVQPIGLGPAGEVLALHTTPVGRCTATADLILVLGQQRWPTTQLPAPD